MSTLSHVDKLAETRNVAVVLRLVVDRRGRLVHGEVVDAEGKLRGRFMGWQAMVRVLRAWLAS